VMAIAGMEEHLQALLLHQGLWYELVDEEELAPKAAVQRVPHKSIIVLEDVDALFAEGRSKANGNKSSLTFSGVLNALDGVGGCAGQIFVLTTNHRERLDPALIRNGRVDLHIEFTHAGKEQMRGLFLAFYNGADESLADNFANGLTELLGDAKVSAAQLQHYFIVMRKESAEVASKHFAKVLEEAEAHGQMKVEAAVKADEPEKEASEEAAKNKASNNKHGSSDGDENVSGGKKPQHIHVHIH